MSENILLSNRPGQGQLGADYHQIHTLPGRQGSHPVNVFDRHLSQFCVTLHPDVTGGCYYRSDRGRAGQTPDKGMLPAA